MNSSDNPFSEFPPSPYAFNNPDLMPQGSPQPGGPSFGKSPQTSPLAVISFVIAAVSPVLFCCCYLSLLTSLSAAVLGHIALYQIGKSNGALSGKAFAIAGLVLGYSIFLINVAIIAFMIFAPQATVVSTSSATPTTRAEVLSRAELKTLSDHDGFALGNTPDAIVLAERFAVRMKELREEIFSKSKAKIQLTGGNFVTHCELHPGKCAFLVHVPSYRNFSEDAKETLATIAWTVAQETVADSLAQGDQLAVGLRGTILYGAVMTGTVSADGSDPDLQSTDEDLLEPFFEVPAEEWQEKE